MTEGEAGTGASEAVSASEPDASFPQHHGSLNAHDGADDRDDPDRAGDRAHPLEGGQTEAVDEAQDPADGTPAKPHVAESEKESSMSAMAARPGGGEQ